MDETTNYGIDSKKMQSVLDAKCCIVLSTDPGLTRLTRNGFMKKFEMTVKVRVRGWGWWYKYWWRMKVRLLI